MTAGEVTYERRLEQERLILAATEAISAQLQRSGMRKRDLAAKLGTSKAYVTQALDGEQNLTLRTLADFAWALGVRVRVSVDPIAAVSGAFSPAHVNLRPPRAGHSESVPPLRGLGLAA